MRIYTTDHPDLPLNAFRKGRYSPQTLEGGKGGSAPPPPDYESAARETARGNLEATRAAIRANRANQYTPWGSLTWRQNPTNKIFNADAYNKALENYNKSKYINTNQREPSYIDGGDYLMAGRRGFLGQGAASQDIDSGDMLQAPRREDFMTFDPDSGWEQTITLTPEAQAALDEQLALNRKYGEVANLGFDRVRSIFENPQLDVGALPQRAINVGQTAQEAIMSRLQPQLTQQDEALRARLANQGITLGSEAYNREMALQSQRANDLMTQAALQGINLDQANRAAALQEQAYLQDRPLNLINALRSGNQVQAPQFQQFAQQATTQGPDMLGAAQADYGARMNAYNAEQAQNAGMMSGLFGLGMGIMGLPIAGTAPGMAGGSLGGKWLSSDIRLKTNIKRIGTHPTGIGIYEYDYVWGGGKQVGVMAQEVETVMPDAVREFNGYKAVNYDRI